jgi:hypothetical protein
MEFQFVNMGMPNQAKDNFFYIHKEKIDTIIRKENVLEIMESFSLEIIKV